MSYSDLDIKVFNRACQIASSMIDYGISVNVALKISNFAISDSSIKEDRNKIFTLMNNWEKEKESTERKKYLTEMLSIIDRLEI